MKKLVLFFSILLVFYSCKKNDAPPPVSLAAETFANLSYGSDPLQKMDVYLPAGRSADSTKLIVLIHGGAWSEGDKSDFFLFVSVLQQRLPGYAIANINYRLASAVANHFPTQENDTKAAIDLLLQKAADYHISQNFVLLGVSAGAHLALLQAYKYRNPVIRAVVDFFGPTDMTGMYNNAGTPTSQAGIQLLMNGTPSSNASLYEQSSPLYFAGAQSAPTLLLHGDADGIVSITQSVALKNKLQSAGVVNQLAIYPGMGHGLWPSPVLNDAFDRIETFLKANVH